MTPSTSVSSPRFVAFLAGQFLGAANDNAFKMTIVTLVLASVLDEPSQVFYSALGAALIPIPFLLFSPLAGSLADRYAKHRVLVGAKLPEVLAMALAIPALHHESLPALFVVLFVMATQSAFFSPAKYGVLPEVFATRDISVANGVLELTTNVAILVGNVAGIFVYGLFEENLAWAGVTYLGVALAGLAAISFAPRAPAGSRATPIEWNILRTARADWAVVRENRALLYTILGIAYFGFLGSCLLVVLPVFGKNEMGLDEQTAGVLLAILSIGIAIGSVLAGKLSQGHVELGLVPLGSLGIFVFAFDLALFAADGTWRFQGVPVRGLVDLIALGISAGFYIIPLNAMLQTRAPAGMKGRLIAFSNVASFTAVLAASAVPVALSSGLGLATDQVILAVTGVTIAGAFYTMSLLPDFFVRLVLWLATNSAYRVRAVGTENLPPGGALFVANHVSWVDFLLIGAACDRMIRFLMFRGYYEWPLLNGFFRRMHAIPVAGGDPPEKTQESLDLARREIADGNVVCIFAEGAITRTGNLLRFRRGLETIAQHADCPIVPVHLGGVWGSLFSFEGGRFFLKRPRGFRSRVTVTFGTPLPPTASAFEVRSAIQQLSADAFREREGRPRDLGTAWLATARGRWNAPFLADGATTVGFGEAVELARAIAAELRRARPERGERVGLMVPRGIAGALAQLGTVLAGKTAVLLDAELDAATLSATLRSVGVERVVVPADAAASVTSAGASPIDVDDLLARARGGRPGALGRARLRFAPLDRARGALLGDHEPAPGDVAIVTFAYPDDTPTPVGVVITHENLLANLEALDHVFPVEADDVVLGVEGWSNPLGWAASLWLPAVAGVETVLLEPTRPLEAAARATLLAAMPERIATLAARDDLELPRLRFAATGAATGGGPIDAAAAEAFARKTGVDVVEGFGLPECAPIVSLNVADFGEGRRAQPGSREGTAGQPLPGIAVRIVDPRTGELLGPDESGRLEVKGPNVTPGYVADPQRTERRLRNGWLDTGTEARVDLDGFLHVGAPTSR